MAQFSGQLLTNRVIGALYNQIISLRVFSDNIGELYGSLMSRSKVDGSLYGDSKLYTSIDIPGTQPWGADAEATNLLQLKRPADPKTQVISIDVYRQTFITIDNYLTKQAFMNEGTFSDFNSTVVSSLRDAKRIYDTTLWNSFVGTEKSAAQSAQNVEIDPDQVPSVAQGAAAAVAKLLIDMKDNSRKYNDYAFERAWDPERIEVIWNADYVADITKFDLPAIFHNDQLIDKFGYKNAIPSRFFGTRLISAGKADGSTIRTLVERTISGVEYFPGDLLPNGTDYEANEAYKQDPNIICILTTADSVPYMSGFEVSTNFFNPKSLTETNYLTFGHNTLQRLADRPWVLVTKKAA